LRLKISETNARREDVRAIIKIFQLRRNGSDPSLKYPRYDRWYNAAKVCSI
jgi:hypothetical protein